MDFINLNFSEQKTIPLTILSLNRIQASALDINYIKQKYIIDSVKSDTVGTVVSIIGDSISNLGIGSTDYGNVFNYATQIASTIFAQDNITNDSLDCYKFRINPQKLTVANSKMMTNKYTGGGWESDTIGQNLITYSYSTTTGSLVPFSKYRAIEGITRSLISKLASSAGTISMTILDRFLQLPELSANPRLSSAYIKFLLFDYFWKNNNGPLLIMWEDNAYIGKVSNFKFTLTDKEPYQILYDFDLIVFPGFVYNLYSGYLTQESYDQIKRVFLRSSSKQFGINVISDIDDEVKQKQLTSEQTAKAMEEDLWYSTLGAYDKNKANYYSKLFKVNNYPEVIDYYNLTPRDLSILFKNNDKIDIFEDSIDPNLKPNLNITLDPYISVESTESTTIISNEVEQEIITEPNQIELP